MRIYDFQCIPENMYVNWQLMVVDTLAIAISG
jgi:hypothetical protein